MTVPTLDDIRDRLRDRKLTVVASETGLHYNTVYRVASGSSKDPAYSVIKRLSDYLSQGDNCGRSNTSI